MGCSASSSSSAKQLSTDPATYPVDAFVVRVDKALRVPALDVGSDSDPYVRVRSRGKTFGRTSVKTNDSNPTWGEVLDVTGIRIDDDVTFDLFDADSFRMADRIGFARVSVRDLIKRPSMVLLLNRPTGGDMVVKRDMNMPTELHVSIVKVPVGWPQPTLSPHYPDVDRQKYPKHVMIITRGTRGDVQPYLALARGLANTMGWLITIVTELRYADFVKKNAAGLQRGCIRYRPSGGDTHSNIDTPISRWAMAHPSELMQLAMLSRTERTFFASEPIFYFWCEVLRPDAIIYGFTLTSIACILSEKFKIPCVGFILQPTVIPSSAYAPVASIDTHAIAWLDRVERSAMTHDWNLTLKKLWEDDPLWKPLSRMRQMRGLRPFRGKQSETYSTILEQGAPIVVPINETAFGGRPKDWPACIKMTDFIFLQGGATPKLSQQILDFCAAARAAGDPVIAMTFSSMPVSRENIISTSLRIVKECASHPRLIALSGPKCKDKLSSSLSSALAEQSAKGKLLELDGAPFGLLFKELDGVLVHGGLGTTADAMRAGIPTTVVGVLLMDQRFWGQAVHALGLGPEMTHIANFRKKCVAVVDDLLLNDKYKANAKALAERIKPKVSEDGVAENVAAIVEAIENAKPIDTSHLGMGGKKDSVASITSTNSAVSLTSPNTPLLRKSTRTLALAVAPPLPSPAMSPGGASATSVSVSVDVSPPPGPAPTLPRRPSRANTSTSVAASTAFDPMEPEPDLGIASIKEDDDNAGVAWLSTREMLD